MSENLSKLTVSSPSSSPTLTSLALLQEPLQFINFKKH